MKKFVNLFLEDDISPVTVCDEILSNYKTN